MRLAEDWTDGVDLPVRRTDVDFKEYSTVLGGSPGNEGSMECGANSPIEFHEAKVSYSEILARLATKTPTAAPPNHRSADETPMTPVATTTTADSRTTLDASAERFLEYASPRTTSTSGTSAKVFGAALLAVIGLLAVRRQRRRAKRRRAATTT